MGCITATTMRLWDWNAEGHRLAGQLISHSIYNPLLIDRVSIMNSTRNQWTDIQHNNFRCSKRYLPFKTVGR